MSCACGNNSGICTCTHHKEGIIVSFPTLIKAHVNNYGNRVVEFEASSEDEDSEGDIILQDSLLKSAGAFIKSGCIDIDHISELCKNPEFAWLKAQVEDPDSFIIGYPTGVKDLGKKRTGVVAEIFKHRDGIFDPSKFKYDKFWESLTNDPPVKWYASVFGFPGDDTVPRGCVEDDNGLQKCATRFLVKSFEWKSTAVTRHPINDSLTRHVKIVTAKAFISALSLDLDYFKPLEKSNTSISRETLRKSYYTHLLTNCPTTDKGTNISITTIRDHYMKCEEYTYDTADLLALATSELVKRSY